MDAERRRGHDRLWLKRPERRRELRLSRDPQPRDASVPKPGPGSESRSRPISAPITEVESAPNLGLGIGLRSAHFGHILEHWPAVDWFEAITENFMDSGGRPGHVLRQVAERYPVVLHGVSMSIGSTDPLDHDYLRKVRVLADDIGAVWVSDHLCWTGVQGANSHDLLPLPLHDETLRHVAARVQRVQDRLGRPLILENPSTYVGFRDTTMIEPDFLRALCEQTDCGLLLDVNNVYVTCFNAGTDPVAYLEAFPFERVVQLHLAGHQDCGDYLIDTHDQPVCDGVWELFRMAWQQTGGASTLLEWDGDVPEFSRVHGEVQRAREFMSGTLDRARLHGTGARSGTSISNPVDFMVPPVMGSTRLEGL